MPKDYSGYDPGYPSGINPIQKMIESEEEKSHIQKVLDQITEESRKLREELLNHFLHNPGMLATFGDDFIVEFGEVSLWTDDQRDLNQFELRIEQKMRFTRRKEDDEDSTELGRDD